jgi:hypothetical protein
LNLYCKIKLQFLIKMIWMAIDLYERMMQMIKTKILLSRLIIKWSIKRNLILNGILQLMICIIGYSANRTQRTIKEKLKPMKSSMLLKKTKYRHLNLMKFIIMLKNKKVNRNKYDKFIWFHFVIHPIQYSDNNIIELALVYKQWVY